MKIDVAKKKTLVLKDIDFPEHEDATQSLSKGNDSWMVAYLDLMTLLLALFIIMGALSHAKAGVNMQGKSEVTKDSEDPGSPKALDATVQRQGQNEGMEKELRKVIGSNSLGGMMDVKTSPGLIRLQMDASLLFKVGRSNVSPAGQDALAKITKIFLVYATNIDVEGHTDNTPILGNSHNSNWSLSALRAVSVVEKLIHLGVPAKRLHATGYADTHPLASNLTPEGRAKNRRVEFVVEMGAEQQRKR